MRYHALDSLRGLTLISMIGYHAVWDIVYLFGRSWPWFYSTGAYLWQQSICWAFILLSGFCWSLGKRKGKRGGTVFAAGALLTVCTLLFMPEQRVVFGILTLLGSCMLLMLPLEKLIGKINPAAGLAGSISFFAFSRNCNDGYFGFENWNWLRLPEGLYRNYFTGYIGFPPDGFYSADYFSLLPWGFLFLAGYFAYRLIKKYNFLPVLEKGRLPGVERLGRYSLPVYLLHQPVIYLILQMLYGG